MEYKRLTDRDVTKVCFDTWELCGLDDVCKRDCRKPEPCKIPQMILRLAQLEDKIENGILVPKYSVVESGNTYCACMVDTSKLLVIGEYETKAEAEKRLEEIRNETKSIDNSEK